MPVIAEATARARLLARRGATAAAVVLGASFHPFRTAREGASMVRGLMNPPRVRLPIGDVAPGDVVPTDVTPAEGVPSPEPAHAEPPGSTASPAPDVPEAAAAEPVAESAAEADDVPVQPRGPAPHIPPRLAGEVERDYGDDLPGIRNAGG